jgi:hypothetical protein
MKEKNKVRRVVNIDKESFDLIKRYCDYNSLKMSEWLPKLALEHIFTAYQQLNESPEKAESSLPEFTSVVKQHVGHPEKFEQFLHELHKKLNTTP